MDNKYTVYVKSGHAKFLIRKTDQEEIEETLESFVDNRYVTSSDEFDILINSISPMDFQVGIPNDGHVLKRDHSTGKWKKINQHQYGRYLRSNWQEVEKGK